MKYIIGIISNLFLLFCVIFIIIMDQRIWINILLLLFCIVEAIKNIMNIIKKILEKQIHQMRKENRV